MSKLKVLIVDDHPVVRMGLKAALEPEDDVEVVGEADSAVEAMRVARESPPDVILMDVRMPEVDGIEACRIFRDQFPDTKVVMLTSYGEAEAVRASILAGASGYLLKNTGRADLLKAVRAVAAGESLLDPAVTARVLKELKELIEQERDRETEILSEREREVLSLVAAGKTNKEIAAELTISENTARNHVSRIMEKLGVSTRTKAATWWVQHGTVADTDAVE